MALMIFQSRHHFLCQFSVPISGRFVGLLLLCLSLLLISGCGFKLRGATGGVLDLPAVFIQGDALNPAMGALRQGLVQRGVETVSGPTAASLVLILGNEVLERRVLSVSTAGRIQEYQLHYSVQFSLREAEGRPLLASQVISLTRAFAYDDLDVMAKSEEQEALYRGMRQEAVQRIIRRLQSLPDSFQQPSQLPLQ